ncbi:MAG: tRNA (adenosine(37)-N6)-dimethylallyltransferase MiaA [Burkholderiales bacterium]
MNLARSSEKLPPAVFLLGPTASGKSELALDLAQNFSLEIVSVDSAQVYRYMDIGTAKPEASIRSTTPHHLIDLVPPTEAYSAGRFRRDALTVMQEIHARGKAPLLVGGTMLYFKALRDGLSELPEADSKLRAEIDSRAAEQGWGELHRELSALDPIAAEHIQLGDSQRIQRALEVCMLTGRRFSEMREQATPFPFRAIAIALVPSERAVLHQRAAVRFRSMLQKGLIEEVQWLRANFALTAAMPSMRCIGYRQVWRYLEGEYDQRGLEEKAVAATRQLAKRQLTWIRAMADVRQFDCFSSNLHTQVKQFIELSLSRSPS